jgi:hypothetical protein
MKNFLVTTLILSSILLVFEFVIAQNNLGQKLSGRILLQVQSHGEAWYVNPADSKKYYLGRPADAFDLMKNLGIGITNDNLNKFPIGLIIYDDQDDDKDGLANRLENALGTDSQNADSDNDGYSDKLEITNNYNPLSTGTLPIDNDFMQPHLGKIFLQTEKAGEAWYICPINQKRYYLSRPTDAFLIMKILSLGVTNENLNRITAGYIATPAKPSTPSTPSTPPVCTNCQTNSASQTISDTASAIRSGNTSKALTHFTPDMQKAVEYTMDFLDSEGKLILGNIMSGAKLSQSSATEVTYSTEVYFSLGGYKIPVNFHVQKQEDGTWLLSNL